MKDVCTELIDFSSEKESTSVDQIGIKCQCVFTGIVHSKYMQDGFISADHTGIRVDNFPGQIHDLLKALSKDRRRFTLLIGQSAVIDVFPGAAEPNAPKADYTPVVDRQDISNGPHVHVQVLKLISGNSAHIRFSVTYTLPNCGGPGSSNLAQAGLRNLRFWIHSQIGLDYLEVRTYLGLITLANKNVSAHDIARLVTVPPLQPGFQRHFINWQEGSDGLSLDFAIEDREKVAAAPWIEAAGQGAVDWDGDLTAETRDYGATGLLSMRLELTGPKSTAVATLVKLGLLVLEQKCRLLEALDLNNPSQVVFLKHLAMTEQLNRNTVRCSAVVEHTGGGFIDGLLSVGATQILGKPLGDLGIGYNPDKHFQPQLTAGVGGIFLSALQTPCQPARMPTTPAIRQKTISTQRLGNNTGSTQPSGQIPAGNSAVSTAQLTACYLDYMLDSEIVMNTGRIALPTGAAKNSQADTSAIVNLHRPTARRQIRIDASRLHTGPQLPNWNRSFIDSNGIRHTVIGDPMISASAPQLSADSRKLLFRAAMQIEYSMSRAPKDGESLPIGSVPYRTSSLNDRTRVLTPESLVAPEIILR